MSSLPACSSSDEPRGQVLDEIKPESGICAPQPGQNVWQQKWADGRDHTHAEGSAERLALGPRGFHEVFAFAKYSARALDNVTPQRGQYDPTLGAVDQGGLKGVFQLLYAGAQGRLRDMTRCCRAAEMTVLGEQDKMLELAKSRQIDHRIADPPFSILPQGGAIAARKKSSTTRRGCDLT